jgi:hypothetical protein
VLFDSDWIVGTSLVGKVVSKDHALAAVDHANAGDNITGWDALLKTGKLSNFEEGGTLVYNTVDTFTGR